ncbi:Disintegrin and metalloproteinase domain-containing protein 23 [Aix galericulata]|nr:Disintegrin and metalloproteinase domain-containing protein 23 [Aix galericulata]
MHWNETAGSIEGVLADEESTFQQNKSSSSKNNSYSSAIQKEITLPSRLIYYINKDSETPYHILDTRARHQQKHNKMCKVESIVTTMEISEVSRTPELLFQLVTVFSNGMFEDRNYLYMIEPMDLTHSTASRGIFEEMKYLELMIVNDHKMFKKHRSSNAYTNNFAKSVVNLVDAIYKEQLNTRVVLVAVETWTDRDRINIHPDPLRMLHDFSKYRQHYIKQHADAVHLLSNVTFHYKRSSLSYFGGVCSVTRGVGVNEYGLPLAMAQELAQSLAQNLGIQWEPAARKPRFIIPGNSPSAALQNTKNFYFVGEVLVFSTGQQSSLKLLSVEMDTWKQEKNECYSDCCKKCSLSNGAHCSDGPCCNTSCLFFPRGYDCRYAVNECDIAEFCTGDSGQCPPNLHKQDGYACDSNQGRCYNGECKTRDNQCKYIWGSKSSGSDKFCYEKLNTEGTKKGNCGKDGDRWIQCSKHGAHVLLDDDTDLGYVEDGAPCGPHMMCLDKKCLPIQSLNISSCPIGSNGKVCSGPSATNLIIGSIAGAILVAAIVLGGTGWGFK